MKKYFIIIFAILIVGFSSWFFYFKNKNLGVACTMDAMACPDGSFVGRIAPKCEFAKCPAIIDSKNDELVLGIGESGSVKGLNISLEKISQDSRCPSDALCVWAGAVEAVVKLVDAKNLFKSEEAKIISIQPYLFGGYEISISDVKPIKNSKIEIKPKDYRVTFKVSNKI